jgi:hypothetical protein
MGKPTETPSFSSRLVVMAMLALALGACAQAPSRTRPTSMDDVIANVHDPKMKKVWLDAQAKNMLPPVDKIQVAENPVTRRQVAQVRAEPVAPRRPVIPEGAVIAVEPFSEKAITHYDGRFDLVAHEPGVLKGRLSDDAPMLEILYRLPDARKAIQMEKSEALTLSYRDAVVGNALQRRIILFDAKTKRAPLVVIAEGGDKPYQTAVKELGLAIEQASTGENPAVTVRYGTTAVTLQQGETRVIGKGRQQMSVYLLNSYAQDKRHAAVDPGPPYYVNIILYQ